MPALRVVLDTSVLVAAIKSRRGASFAILERVGTGAFDVVVSVPHAEAIVTHNRRDFLGAESLGLAVLTPGEFLRRIPPWAP